MHLSLEIKDTTKELSITTYLDILRMPKSSHILVQMPLFLTKKKGTIETKILEDGVHKWRRESGYYQQSQVENTFYRYKTILGKKLRARTKESRKVETILGCQILNRFLELGRCDSKLVA